MQKVPARGRTSLKHNLRKMGNDWQLYVLALPSIAYIFIFSYIPMYGVQIAFKNFRPSLGILGSDWVGLKHFISFVNVYNFPTLIANTLRISLYGLAAFPLSIIFALLVNELDNIRFKKTVQMLSYMPHFISTVVVCSMVTLFFHKSYGFINHIITFWGGDRVMFLEQPKYFASLYVWSGVWQGLGWGSILYISALSGVSPDLVEAAYIDGASRIQVILHVKIPSILPTIVICLILACGGVLNVGFEKVFLLQNSLNLDVSQVISTYTYEVGLVGAKFSYGAAIGLFQTIVNLILLIGVNFVSKRLSEISLW